MQQPAVRSKPEGQAEGGATHAIGLLAGILLIAAVAFAFLPGIASVPPVDRDEPRYTQATKQMMETGDYVRIRFQDEPRHKKPIGIHWLQAASASLAGGAGAPLVAYRVPSLLGAIAAVLLTVWLTRAFLPLPASLAVGALFGATIILGVEARLAKTDAVLLASVLAAQGALARLWLARTKSLAMPLVFWGALSVGILVKGPVAPMVLALTVATLAILDGRGVLWRLRPLLGAAIVAALCLPWFVAIYAATDGAFYSAALGKDFLGKAATGQEGHGAPPLTHAALFLVVAWPLSAFAIPALWGIWRRRGSVFLFAFAWVVPAWIVFELVPTKLPHYTLPLVPGIALATLAALEIATPARIARIVGAVLLAAVPVAALAALPVLAVLLGRSFPQGLGVPLAIPAVLLALASLAALLTSVRVLRRELLLSRGVLAPAIASAVIAQATIWGLLLPSIGPVWLSPRLVAAVETASSCASPRLISVGFNEPSLVFLAGTDTLLAKPEEAVAAASGCVVLAVRDRDLAAVEDAAQKTSTALRPVGEVEGFNISKGDALTIHLFVPG